MRKEDRCALVAMLMAAGVIPALAGSVYSVFYDDRFGTIDSATGAFVQLGTLPIPQSSGIAAFQNVLFAQSLQGELITINPATGASTDVGTSPTWSVAFGGGTNGLYEVDSMSNLYSIDPATGALTLIGATGLPANYQQWDTSLSDDGLNLWFTAGGAGAKDELYELNTLTGQATDIGSTGVTGIAGSAIVDGNLDLFQYNAGTDYIYSAPLGSTDFTADTVLSAQIVDGGTLLGGMTSLDTVAEDNVPEPATFLLIGSGLVAFGLRHRRKYIPQS